VLFIYGTFYDVSRIQESYSYRSVSAIRIITVNGVSNGPEARGRADWIWRLEKLQEAFLFHLFWDVTSNSVLSSSEFLYYHGLHWSS